MVNFFRIVNGRCLIEGKLVKKDLFVKNGVFVDAGLPEHVVDASGCIVAPGFIDLQLNGGFGVDFSHSLQGIDQVQKALPQTGVTSFAPTVISQPAEKYTEILSQQKRISAQEGAEVLFFHLEGPFLAKEKKGMHPPVLKTASSIEQIEQVYGSLDGVGMITLAPEVVTPSVIEQLVSKGIVVAVGHTISTCKEMIAAKDVGATIVTHLFNAMRSFHHRETGPIGFVLLERGMSYSLIVDGVHVAKEAVCMATQLYPEGLVLISDAGPCLGMEDGRYLFGGISVEKNADVVMSSDQTLAGSCVGMDQMVRNLKEYTGCSTEYALSAASAKPALIAGIQDRKGFLKSGSDADFVFLDDNLYVQQAFVQGGCCFTITES